MNPPDIYQETIRRVKSSEIVIGSGMTDSDVTHGQRIAAFSKLEAQKTQSVASPTLGRGVEVHDDLPNARGRSLEAFDEHDPYVTQQMALQSSLTIVASKEQPKPPKLTKRPILCWLHGMVLMTPKSVKITFRLASVASLIIFPRTQ